MNREQKAAVIEEVTTQIKESEAVFAVDYRGISVPQAAELRERLLEADATLRVVKNTLTERAVDQAGAEGLKNLLEGPTAFTFVKGDAALAAKVIATFRRENQVLEFKGGSMDGATLSIDQIEAIAKLPAREVLHGQMVGVLASPVVGLVRGLNQLIAGLALQLGQIAEQGLVSGEAPPDTPAAEEAPAEEGSAPLEAPVEEGSAPLEAPAEEGAPATEEAPAVGEAPAVEEAPVEEAPAVEEAPVEEAPVEEAPVEDASAEEAPPTDASAEEAPPTDAPVDDAAAVPEASGDTPAETDETEAPDEDAEETKEG